MESAFHRLHRRGRRAGNLTDVRREIEASAAPQLVTDSKATQTLSLSEAGATAGLVITQPPGGDPTLIYDSI